MDQWLGMGNQELLDNFKDYEKDVKARHSYGPKGHRGMSVLIFESSVVGYMEAERLNKHFENEGTDRDAWDQSLRRILYYPGGQRQLYGYMATKRDLDFFNQHCQGHVVTFPIPFVCQFHSLVLNMNMHAIFDLFREIEAEV